MSAIIAALLSTPHLTLTCVIKLTKSERQLLPEMDKILTRRTAKSYEISTLRLPSRG